MATVLLSQRFTRKLVPYYYTIFLRNCKKIFCRVQVAPALNQADVGFLFAGYRNGQPFCPKLLSEITYSFQKANIGSRKTAKWMKMVGNVGFLRRLGQNRQHRTAGAFCSYVVMKGRNCFLLQHFRGEAHLRGRQKQLMLYFFTKAVLATTFWL